MLLGSVSSAVARRTGLYSGRSEIDSISTVHVKIGWSTSSRDSLVRSRTAHCTDVLSQRLQDNPTQPMLLLPNCLRCRNFCYIALHTMKTCRTRFLGCFQLIQCMVALNLYKISIMEHLINLVQFKK